jgi:hypothetical protein
MGSSSSKPKVRPPHFPLLPLPESLLTAFRSIPDLIVLLPNDQAYKENQVSWNWDVLGTPAVMLIPQDESQLAAVMKAVHSFYQSDLSMIDMFPLCPCSGRHSHVCSVDNGLMIDMQKFKGLKVDKETNIVTAGAGLRLGELDEELQKHGLAIPVGTNPDTGISGLTLGGGFGFLSRKFGLTVDYLLSVRVVLPNGEIIEANEQNEREILWAHRGGGGNFGLVTEFQYQAMKQGDPIHGACVYPTRKQIFGFPGAPTLMKNWRNWCSSNPNDTMSLGIITCNSTIVLVYGYTGDDYEQGNKLMAGARANGKTPICTIMRAPYAHHSGSLQRSAEKEQAAGHYYEAGLLVPELTDEVLEILLKFTDKPEAPNTKSMILLFQLGGAIAEKARDSAAFWHRDIKFWILLLGKWDGSEAERTKVRDWSKRFRTAMEPFVVKTDYNTIGKEHLLAIEEQTKRLKEEENIHDSDDRPPVEIYFNANLPRLQAVKTRCDPLNMLRLNKNVYPIGWKPSRKEKETKKEEDKSQENKQEQKEEKKEEKKEEATQKEEKSVEAPVTPAEVIVEAAQVEKKEEVKPVEQAEPVESPVEAAVLVVKQEAEKIQIEQPVETEKPKEAEPEEPVEEKKEESAVQVSGRVPTPEPEVASEAEPETAQTKSTEKVEEKVAESVAEAVKSDPGSEVKPSAAADGEDAGADEAAEETSESSTANAGEKKKNKKKKKKGGK